MSKRTLVSTALLIVACSFRCHAEVTYSRDVAPILFQKCTGCHHPNDLAPMSLLDYKSARPWAKAIREAVVLKKMPPWFADSRTGKFANDPTLTDIETRTIVEWVDHGAKEGDSRDIPSAPSYFEGWRIGKPDAVIDIGQDYRLKSSLRDEYVYLTVPTHFAEGHWVRAVELRPGNRKVVHHAHVVVVLPKDSKPSDSARKRSTSFSDYLFHTPDGLRHMKPDAPVVNDACSYTGPEIDGLRIAGEGSLASFLPGMPPDSYPDDSAKWIPPGAEIRFEIHYHNELKSDEPVTDRTSVGLIFASTPPRHPLRRLDVDNDFFAISPGNATQEVKQCAVFTSDSLLLTLTPHMHYLGKDARFEIQQPGEEPKTLLWVPRYDFNWQLKYKFQDPVFVTKGTRLILTFHYDNSANNPADPDPRRTVRWGEPSQEEMMSGWIDYIEARPSQPAASETAAR